MRCLCRILSLGRVGAATATAKGCDTDSSQKKRRRRGKWHWSNWLYVDFVHRLLGQPERLRRLAQHPSPVVGLRDLLAVRPYLTRPAMPVLRQKVFNRTFAASAVGHVGFLCISCSWVEHRVNILGGVRNATSAPSCHSRALAAPEAQEPSALDAEPTGAENRSGRPANVSINVATEDQLRTLYGTRTEEAAEAILKSALNALGEKGADTSNSCPPWRSRWSREMRWKRCW
jgi:hypothetical protein